MTRVDLRGRWGVVGDSDAELRRLKDENAKLRDIMDGFQKRFAAGKIGK